MTMKRIVLFLFILTHAVVGRAMTTDSTNRHAEKDSTFFVQTTAVSMSEASDILTDNIAPVENDSVQRYIDLARAVMSEIKRTQNFIKTIDASTKFKLPVGISKTI